ncbi:hypothetical protein [Cryobacterium sp. Hh7]|uniref:hypothetical protein n=1 Tax=Cryobacterium sp. Hh7 TaxID=1259159 RepID=UPI00141A7F0A|nr:hypothetical protein [Cryobacterium sp. Hh7]
MPPISPAFWQAQARTTTIGMPAGTLERPAIFFARPDEFRAADAARAAASASSTGFEQL